ncbi:hypothetical protein B0H67DRAFT_644972 [Lasiosphaeris hirsuta]|uniref:Uncharacterized protein n=1 Tax=Lasiosphaeris hirsuta TaxID=260670 RepID=A0AA40DVZ5_9PEZI|nr:hypothetical protein B0H67DRAFT_644972 [Lasiosphaeris hirsuta]
MQFTTSAGLLAWGLLAQLGSAVPAPEGDSPVLIVVPGTKAGSDPLPTSVIVVPGSGSGSNPVFPTAVLTVPGSPAVPQWPTGFLTKGKDTPVFPTWVPRAAPAIPKSCTSVVRGQSKGPSCYTATATVTKSSCATLKCAEPTNIMCPAYIKLETRNVPCANSCCPTTKTKTVTKACATCSTGCVIPTQTVTQTTGCGVNPTLVPLPTAVLTFVG